MGVGLYTFFFNLPAPSPQILSHSLAGSGEAASGKEGGARRKGGRRKKRKEGAVGGKGELHLDLISFSLIRHEYGNLSKHGHEYTFLNRENELNLNMQIIIHNFQLLKFLIFKMNRERTDDSLIIYSFKFFFVL